MWFYEYFHIIFFLLFGFLIGIIGLYIFQIFKKSESPIKFISVIFRVFAYLNFFVGFIKLLGLFSYSNFSVLWTILSIVQLFIIGIVYFYLSRGLLEEKKWAWLGGLIILSIGLIFSIIGYLASFFEISIFFFLPLIFDVFLIFLLIQERKIFIEKPTEKISQCFRERRCSIVIIGIFLIFLFNTGILIYQYGMTKNWWLLQQKNEVEMSKEAIIEKPYIEIISPNGGEEWIFGNTYNIKWESSEVDKVYIYLGRKRDDKYEDKIRHPDDWVEKFISSEGGISASIGEYSWTANSKFFSSDDKYKIRIVAGIEDPQHGKPIGSILFDESDNYFSIMGKDEITDWKTYRNEEYGYEIKYPSEKDFWLDFKADSELPLLISNAQDYFYGEDAENVLGKFPLGEEVVSNIRFEVNYFINYEGMGLYIRGAHFFTKYKDNYYVITISKEGLGTTLDSEEFWAGERILSRKGEELVVERMANKEDEFMKIFSKVLSTFRFLEQN